MAEVRIYTTRTCPYCFAVKRLFTKKGVAFQEIDVTGDSATRAWLRQATGQHTVPQVFIDDRPYGGFTDVDALERRGVLDRVLRGEHED